MRKIAVKNGSAKRAVATRHPGKKNTARFQNHLYIRNKRLDGRYIKVLQNIKGDKNIKRCWPNFL